MVSNSVKKISIVVPTYNEEGNMIPITDAIIQQLEQKLPNYDYELIFIDNHSNDSTRMIIRNLCASNPRIKAIFNIRNYGGLNSPFYGLLQATGDCVILMCADFQDPVELIPKYVEQWESGYKIVLGQRTSCKEKGLIRRMRALYYKIMKKHSEITFIENVIGTGLYDRSFIEILRTVDDPHPFLRALISELGHDVKLIPFEQPKRKTGKSHYNFLSYYDVAMQSITTYTKTGVRAAVLLGTISVIGSIVATLGVIVYKLFNWDTFTIGFNWFWIAVLIIASFQLLFIGIVGEYVLDVNTRVRKRPLVIEEERINFQ